MGKFYSKVKDYYSKLGNMSDDKDFKKYTDKLGDMAEDEKKEDPKSTYPLPDEKEAGQEMEKHKGAF